MAAAFGAAAFGQPGLGRAHLSGVAGIPALEGRSVSAGTAAFDRGAAARLDRVTKHLLAGLS